MQVKQFNALANREFLLFVAIVASAITLHVREQMIDARPAPASPDAQSQVSRLCEPAQASADKARVLPADCDMRTNVRTAHSARPWV
jgi:hypothetical protein